MLVWLYRVFGCTRFFFQLSTYSLVSKEDLEFFSCFFLPCFVKKGGGLTEKEEKTIARYQPVKTRGPGHSTERRPSIVHLAGSKRPPFIFFSLSLTSSTWRLIQASFLNSIFFFSFSFVVRLIGWLSYLSKPVKLGKTSSNLVEWDLLKITESYPSIFTQSIIHSLRLQIVIRSFKNSIGLHNSVTFN